MSKKRDMAFTVETKEAGQRRPYADSHYHYIVESKLSIQMIEAFCTKLLSPAIPYDQYKKEQGDSASNHFRQYYTELKTLNEVKFMEDGLNIVEYKVVSPSTH